MGSRPPFWRKKWLVRPEYQLRLAASLFIYVAIYSLILGFLIFYPLYYELSTSVDIEKQLQLSTIVLYLHKRVWLGFFLVSVLAGLHVIFSTHRLVGPVYRFEKTIEEFLKGNYGGRITIRKGDGFKEMEGLLNRLGEMLERTKTREEGLGSGVKTRLDNISAMLESGHERGGTEIREEVDGLLRELDKRQGRGTE